MVKNASAMADEFVARGYKIISGGTDNHCMLIDLRSKGVTGKDADAALGKAEITVNKNMVPFDDQPPMISSGIRVGTPAITTRGLKEKEVRLIVDLMDRVITNSTNESVIAEVKTKVHELMSGRPLFAH